MVDLLSVLVTAGSLAHKTVSGTWEVLSTFLMNRWPTAAHADCGVEAVTGHWESPILQVIESNSALLHMLLRQLYTCGRYPK